MSTNKSNRLRRWRRSRELAGRSRVPGWRYLRRPATRNRRWRACWTDCSWRFSETRDRSSGGRADRPILEFDGASTTIPADDALTAAREQACAWVQKERFLGYSGARGGTRSGGEAAPRRAAEHRAARGARAGARRAASRSIPSPRRARPQHPSPLRRQRARPARAPTARWPTTCAPGRVRHARGRVAARQLPPGRRPRSATSARTCRGTYYRELPTLASREHAGHARVYAMAVELIRHSDSRLDRQQLARFSTATSASRR